MLTLQAVSLCPLASVGGAIRGQREGVVRDLLPGSFPFLDLGHVYHRGTVLGVETASHCGCPLEAS